MASILSMIVQQIDQFDIDADEPERYPPIAVDPNRPVPFQASLERVQAKARQTQIAGSDRDIQSAQYSAQLVGVGRLNTPGRAGAVIEFESLVPEADDHGGLYRVSLRDAMRAHLVLALKLAVKGAVLQGGEQGVEVGEIT